MTLQTVRAAELRPGDSILGKDDGTLHVLTAVDPFYDLLEVAWAGGCIWIDYDAPVLRVSEVAL
jgi:hypothetical protein